MIIKKTFLILSGIFIAFLSAELCVRAARLLIPAMTVPSSDPALPYENRKNAKVPEDFRYFFSTFNYYRFNRYGMRGKDFDFSRTPGAGRIIILGDSIVLGALVKEKDTFCSRLEELLNSVKTEPSKKYEVLNAGVSSYNAWNYAAYLKHTGIKFRPDTVVVGVCLNDVLDRPKNGIDKRPAAKNGFFYTETDSNWSLYRKLLLSSELVRGLIPALPIGRLMSFHKPVSQNDFNRLYGFFKENKTPDAIIQFLKSNNYSLSDNVLVYLKFITDRDLYLALKDPFSDICGFCAKNNIRLIFLIFPLQFHVDAEYVDPEPQATLMGIFKDLGARAIDLKSAFRNYYLKTGKSVFTTRGDLMHPNAEGHKIVAGLLYDEIKK